MNNNNYFPLERNQYFYGKMLTARDFEIEQRYHNNKRRLINRTILGAGVVWACIRTMIPPFRLKRAWRLITWAERL